MSLLFVFLIMGAFWLGIYYGQKLRRFDDLIERECRGVMTPREEDEKGNLGEWL